MEPRLPFYLRSHYQLILSTRKDQQSIGRARAALDAFQRMVRDENDPAIVADMQQYVNLAQSRLAELEKPNYNTNADGSVRGNTTPLNHYLCPNVSIGSPPNGNRVRAIRSVKQRPRVKVYSKIVRSATSRMSKAFSDILHESDELLEQESHIDSFHQP